MTRLYGSLGRLDCAQSQAGADQHQAEQRGEPEPLAREGQRGHLADPLCRGQHAVCMAVPGGDDTGRLAGCR